MVKTDIVSVRIILHPAVQSFLSRRCENWHGYEHLLGEQIHSALKRNGLYRHVVNGFTGPDRIVVSIDAPDDQLSWTTIVKVASGTLKSIGQTSLNTGQIALLQSDQHANTSVSRAADFLADQTFHQDALGDSKKYNHCDRRSPKIASVDWIVVTTLPPANIRLSIASAWANSRSPEADLQRVGALRLLDGSGSLYYVDSADARLSLIFWMLLLDDRSRQGRDFRGFNITPLGDRGYLARLPQSIDRGGERNPVELASVLPPEKLTPDRFAAAAEKAHSLYCRRFDNLTPSRLADGLSIDPWASPFAKHRKQCDEFNHITQSAVLDWAQRYFSKLADVKINEMSPELPLKRIETQRFTLCAKTTSLNLSRFEQITLRRLILEHLRFVRQYALNIELAPSGSCYYISVQDPQGMPNQTIVEIRAAMSSAETVAYTAVGAACVEYSNQAADGLMNNVSAFDKERSCASQIKLLLNSNIVISNIRSFVISSKLQFIDSQHVSGG